MNDHEEPYQASPIKSRTRRTKAQMKQLQSDLYFVTREIQPATVRQVFYQMVTRGYIDKTENGYDTVGRELLKLRRSGRIPYDWIADNTRMMRKPSSHSNLRLMLDRQVRLYRRALWDDQPAYVEVWLEKDALSGVLLPVTSEWDVPLMITRGFSSESFLYGAARDAVSEIVDGKKVYYYYLGDHDPSGVVISQSLERRFREMLTAGFSPDIHNFINAAFHFIRIAVLPEQIAQWDLPTRPTKTVGNRHARDFTGESVEVDAIEPERLRGLVRDSIEQHIDTDRLEATQRVEKLERATLADIIAGLPESA